MRPAIYAAAGGAVTMVNAGSIGGGTYAVRLGAGYANRVVIDPGAMFSGTVSGGNTIGAPVVSTLELASGASAGTLSGLGTRYVDFARVTVDSGAYWTMQATDSVQGGVTLTNAGTLGGPLTLAPGGVFINAASGTATGAGAVYGEAVGPATVTNYGVIAEAGGPLPAIDLAGGGSVINQSGGTISGYQAVSFGGTGTVVNAGSIAGTVYGAYLGDGGSITNQAGGSITVSGSFGDAIEISGQAGTVTNLGFVNAGTARLGIDLSGGGIITNGTAGGTASSAYIAGYSGGIRGDKSTNTTLTNYGTVSGTVGYAIQIFNGTVVNGPSGATGALITTDDGSGVVVEGAGSVTNYGQIISSSTRQAFGVNLSGPGTISNLGGTALIEATVGVYASGYGTVINAGTIASSSFASGVAVAFGGGTNRLIVDPGAVFIGTVSGGGPVNVTTSSYVYTVGNTGPGTTTLELAAGSSPGTLSGLGTKYVGFAQVTVDPGSYWTLAGANTLAAGTTLTNAQYLANVGTLTNAGAIYGPLTLAAGNVLSNASTGLITGSGHAAIYGASYASVAVVNAGVIAENLGPLPAIYLDGGGSITNQIGGTISAYGGIVILGAATVVNAGRITGVTNGIYIGADGTVINGPSGATGALIESGIGDGVGIGGPGTIINAGQIEATGGGHGYGVALGGSGAISNLGMGSLIQGVIGVYAGQNDTVTNAGTIASNSITGYAVVFGGGDNRLIVDPGAVFTGTISGNGPVAVTVGSAVYTIGTTNGIGSTTLELASAASAGTLAGFGTSLTNFSTLQFDSGAAWTVSGNDSASGLGTLAITGFGDNDTIDLTGFVAVGDTFASNTLVLTDGGGDQETLAIDGDFTTGSFQIGSDGAGGTDVIVCFAASTMIDTPDGEVAVEGLKEGDLVSTLHNGPRPVKWVGKGKVLSTPCRRTAATPVIVRKHALGKDLPRADLRVTKAHSLYIDDVLIPVEFLVNHRSIIWDDRAQELEIYHVELDSHDVLIANGVAAESYRDDGNRWLFRNANPGWESEAQAPYAPVLTGGPVVDAAWRRLLDLSGPRVLPPMTDDPDLHLIVDGVRVNAEQRGGSSYRFRLPCRPSSVVIASREAVPAEFGIARDARSLGVALRWVEVWQGARLAVFDADDERLAAGFHDYEAEDHLRWTDGRGALPGRGVRPASTRGRKWWCIWVGRRFIRMRGRGRPRRTWGMKGAGGYGTDTPPCYGPPKRSPALAMTNQESASTRLGSIEACRSLDRWPGQRYASLGPVFGDQSASGSAFPGF